MSSDALNLGDKQKTESALTDVLRSGATAGAGKGNCTSRILEDDADALERLTMPDENSLAGLHETKTPPIAGALTAPWLMGPVTALSASPNRTAASGPSSCTKRLELHSPHQFLVKTKPAEKVRLTTRRTTTFSQTFAYPYYPKLRYSPLTVTDYFGYRVVV